MAEANLKIAKALKMKCEGNMTKVNAGMRSYRNTPVTTDRVTLDEPETTSERLGNQLVWGFRPPLILGAGLWVVPV